MPWQKKDTAVKFGQDPTPSELLRLASQINTFTEGTDTTSSQILEIRESMSNATMLIFLGFAFHQLNMKLLEPSVSCTTDYQYFGTANGLSKSDCNVIHGDIQTMMGRPSFNSNLRQDLRCANIFREYWRTFSLSYFKDPNLPMR